jgi:hypothetical protein
VRSPSFSPTTLAVVTGAVLITAGLTAVVLLGRPSPSPSPSPSGPPQAEMTPDPTVEPVSIDPTTCALEKQPGPDDRVPKGGGDAIDVADLGNGRWRLCQTGPVVIVVEGSAWCTWTDDRTAVREVVGLPVDDGNLEKVDGGVTLDANSTKVYLGLTSSTGDVLGFEGGEGREQVDAAADGRAGAALFHLAAVTDPEHPPAIRPADRVGSMRWACGDPPPPRPGRATGRVTLRLDDPVGAAWQVAGMCNWVTTPTGARLQRVESNPPAIQRDGAKLAIIVGPDLEDPDRAEVSLWVDRGTDGDFYQTTDGSVAVRQAHDGASGLIRIRHLTIDPSSPARIAPDVTDVSGVVAWSCPPPAVAGPADEPVPPGEVSEPHSGHATINLDPPVVGAIGGDVTCTVDRSGSYARVDGLRGSFAVAGGRIELRSDTGSVLVAVIGADGQPAGEYTGQVRESSDDAALPALTLLVTELSFEPVDPQYVPLGGPGASRTLRLTLDYTCDIDTKLP